MPNEFYHVDRSNEVEEGNQLELEQTSRLRDQIKVVSSAQNEEALSELYPEGLSRHGSRYAHAALVRKEGESLPENYEPMAGLLNLIDVENNSSVTHTISPFSVKDEFILELERQAHFDNKPSRFQSFFGFDHESEAIKFAKNHRGGEARLFKVRCDDYLKCDIDLVSGMFFGEALSNAKKYWLEEAGSDDPMWELVMQPPVEVIEYVGAIDNDS